MYTSTVLSVLSAGICTASGLIHNNTKRIRFRCTSDHFRCSVFLRSWFTLLRIQFIDCVLQAYYLAMYLLALFAKVSPHIHWYWSLWTHHEHFLHLHVICGRFGQIRLVHYTQKTIQQLNGSVKRIQILILWQKIFYFMLQFKLYVAGRRIV